MGFENAKQPAGSRHGWRGACIALAGLAAQCAVAGMAMKGGPRQKVDNIPMKGGPREKKVDDVRRQQVEEDERLLADEGRIGKKEMPGVQQQHKGSKSISSFLSPPFLALVAANPPAVLGHYTVYMFLPAVS